MEGRDVIGGAAAPEFATRPDEIRAVLLHLGENMWCDWPLDLSEDAKLGAKAPHRKLRMNEAIWRASVDLAVERKFNMLLIDVGEGVIYPSHPELAVEGSWSPDRLRAELKRLRALGLEPIPKLNFSNTHNGWLKEYRRMVSTPEYYQVCADLIRDIAEIFDHPRLLHIGYDEETFGHQKRLNYVALRQGELWWHDFLWFISTVEKNGMRAWSWSDYGWYHPDFVTRCPTSVVQSNGYYDEYLEGFDLDSPKLKACRTWLELYVRFEKAGFDQIPCGSNWNSDVRRQRGPKVNDSMIDLVAFCRRHVSAEHLKGFLMAPWVPCNTAGDLSVIREGFDIFASCFASGAMPDVEEIKLAGDYAGHLQDVWFDGTFLYWAHTLALIKTDLSGNIIVRADVNEHHAGIEVRNGKVYVAVCVLQTKTGGKTLSDSRVTINVYDANTLKLLEEHVTDINDRSGSLAILDDGTFLVGCLRPQDIAKTQVRFHHLDRDCRLIKSYVLDNVPVKLGIETIKRRSGNYYLNHYDKGGLCIKLDRDFKEVARYRVDGTCGLIFDGGNIWIGRTKCTADRKRWVSSLKRVKPPVRF